VRSNLDFFDRYAWDEASGSYASELDQDGALASPNRDIVALSRLVYAKSQSPAGSRDLGRARRAQDFILQKMTTRDRHGLLFRSAVDAGGVPQGDRPYVFSFEQSYPVAGLVALYTADRAANRELLPVLRDAAQSYWRRFHDDEHGGLFYYWNSARQDHANDQGLAHQSYQSTVYPVSSFMLALRDADPENRATYDGWIRELLQVAIDRLVETRDGQLTGWLRERFVAAAGAPLALDDTYRMTEAGHVTQLAWVLRIAAERGIAPDGTTAARYLAVSRTLLERFVAHGGLSPIGAVYDAFDRVTGQPWLDERGRATSAWWSNLEAMIAFGRAARADAGNAARYAPILQGLSDAYFAHFVDGTRGGEYFRIDTRDGQVVDATKGGPGKSGYHSLEAYRYLFGDESAR
jgi:mannose/cellobiose epimerase-like protein (N-acyl-D-glucosamine 2-epimerase family)